MNKINKTEGFGVPVGEDGVGLHFFNVLIPLEKHGEVIIEEAFGYERGQGDNPNVDKILRASINKKMWDKISKVLKEDFNPRLEAKKIKKGNWVIGENKIDRVIGKELCLLAWAIEQSESDSEIENIKSKWSNLSPEERWWLFRMISIGSGTAEDKNKSKGWRKAIYIAFSE